jgi:hypothetical protein
MLELNRDAVDANLGVLLAMAVFHPVAFSSFLFEDHYLISFEVSEDAGRH